MVITSIRNKRGNFEQTIFALVMILSICLFLFFLVFFAQETLPKISSALTDSTPAEAGRNVTEILDKTETSTERFDNWIPLLLVGIFGYLFVTLFFVKSHPMLFFIGLIVLGVALILAAVYSNIYEELKDKPQFSDVEAEMTISGILMSYLPQIIFVVFILTALIIWVLNRGSAGGGYGP